MRATVTGWLDRNGPALISPGREDISHAGLARAALDLDDRLGALGLTGHRIAFLSQDQILCTLAAFGLAMRNSFAPVNPAYRGERINTVLDALDSDVLMTDDPASFRAANGARVLITFDGRMFDILQADLADLSVGVPSSARMVLLTAGSSGTPKCVGYTMAQLENTARINAAHFGLGPQDRYLSPMPMHHAHGLVSIAWVTLWAGGSVILTHGDLPATLDALLHRAPTCLSCVPTLHSDLAALIEAGGHQISGLRFARSSSAPLNYAMVERLETNYGCPLVETYGLTESTTVVVANLPGERRIGSVGRPIGDTQAALLNQDQILCHGSGELLLRGTSVIQRYLDTPNLRSWTRGWFRTGDLAEIDSDGFIRIVGREKEMVKRGGLTVFLPEVDRALEAVPGIVAARAFAAGHDRLGEDLVAVVECAPEAGLDEQTVLARVASTLPRYKTPSRLALIPRLPRNEVGKIVRRDLATEFLPLFSVPAEPGHPADATDDLEQQIIAFCAEEMQVEPDSLDPNAPFFDAGAMDSFSIEALLMLMEHQAGVRLRLGDPVLEDVSTIADLAAVIRAQPEGGGGA